MCVCVSLASSAVCVCVVVKVVCVCVCSGEGCVCVCSGEGWFQLRTCSLFGLDVCNMALPAER